MATETFFKDIIIDDKAADILIAGLERPRKTYMSTHDIDEELRSGEEWLKQRAFRLKKHYRNRTRNRSY